MDSENALIPVDYILYGPEDSPKEVDLGDKWKLDDFIK